MMKKQTAKIIVSAMVLLLSTGCSLVPNSNTQIGAIKVAYKTNSPVYINGVLVGMTNQEITGLNAGTTTITIGDPENPIWTGQVSVTSGDVTTVIPDEGETPSNPDGSGEISPGGTGGGVVYTPNSPTDSGGATETDTLAYTASLVQDFTYRDSLPQTNTPQADWFKYSTWGPMPATYPAVTVPSGTPNEVQWKRDRVIEVAKHYIGVPYKHYHIPQLGLDCSNFTSWVYNYGFGIRFTSAVVDQALVAGRKLTTTEPLEKGDLLFFWNPGRTAIGHAAIYIDQNTLIDSTVTSTSDGVAVRAFKYWYKDRFAYGRRIFE